MVGNLSVNSHGWKVLRTRTGNVLSARYTWHPPRSRATNLPETPETGQVTPPRNVNTSLAGKRNTLPLFKECSHCHTGEETTWLHVTYGKQTELCAEPLKTQG